MMHTSDILFVSAEYLQHLQAPDIIDAHKMVPAGSQKPVTVGVPFNTVYGIVVSVAG